MLLTSNSLHLLVYDVLPKSIIFIHVFHWKKNMRFLPVDLQDKTTECTFTLQTAYSQAMLTENICCSSRISRTQGMKGRVGPFLLLPRNSRYGHMEQTWSRAGTGQGCEGICLAIQLEKQLWVNTVSQILYLYHMHSRCGQLWVAPLKNIFQRIKIKGRPS